MSPRLFPVDLGCTDHDCAFSLAAGVGTNGGCKCVPRTSVSREEALVLVARCMALGAALDAAGLGVTLGQRIPRMLVPIIAWALHTDAGTTMWVNLEASRELRAELVRVRDELRACMGADGGAP
jgi:hypothetical protein